jgi:hypothetical protein
MGLTLKTLVTWKFFLGIKITHSKKNFFLLQLKYVLDLLRQIRKLGCKSSSTPMDWKKKLNTEDGRPLENINQYQR